MFKPLALIALSFCFLFSEEPSEMGAGILEEAGLSHLSNEDKIKVLKLFTSAVVDAENERQNESAKIGAGKFLESQGYIEVFAGVSERAGTKILLVKNGALNHATLDVPLMLNDINLPFGRHYAQTSAIGGVSSIIDVNGREHRIIIANWKAVP